jgi:hypothetical protein
MEDWQMKKRFTEEQIWAACRYLGVSRRVGDYELRQPAKDRALGEQLMATAQTRKPIRALATAVRQRGWTRA